MIFLTPSYTTSDLCAYIRKSRDFSFPHRVLIHFCKLISEKATQFLDRLKLSTLINFKFRVVLMKAQKIN